MIILEKTKYLLSSLRKSPIIDISPVPGWLTPDFLIYLKNRSFSFSVNLSKPVEVTLRKALKNDVENICQLEMTFDERLFVTTLLSEKKKFQIAQGNN